MKEETFKDKKVHGEVLYDHMNEQGDYVIHVYEIVTDNPETGEGHTATWGWYAVDPITGEIKDDLIR